ncbi:glutamine-hydrolyzing carbamoyl-phosphate synthase small subunit [Dokdonella sp.]|uniref:glutamine-hydrolyzing carbamoyl-phosphate synthase small subunit n=1 Tax=Dokdonella sp. TaxID=2291710 RepID=UPI0025BBA6BA|nr:glutamine-hydrolyzing carbamoyl-phosphate synthase small subunit [Dokdonella sp.]MBX3693201.1 glutamine-hydrolyzing carbamoyl-phosphate synthase small subunit [Dokdonella sp.]MCW5568318.1 glutamine-hydrolyzing carbamoyl-phosphate synthase small subunit [Dokdonella sp.]
MTTPALLALADGSLFEGRSIGAHGGTTGEVVFNTAMTGYQEILTDPSYARQIVTLTCPHIGNTGCNRADAESDRVHAGGLVIRDLPLLASSWRNEIALDDYLKQHGVVAIADIDTRRLTRILRDTGAQGGCILAGDGISAEAALASARTFPGLAGMDLAKIVSTSTSHVWNEGTFDLDRNKPRIGTRRFRVAAYDFGVKHNILRMLVDRGCEVTVLPAQTPASEVFALAPDGVFLSNGPGDPQPCDYAITAIREFIRARLPIFGICLGHQLLGLAAGARTLKMKFGHHGANHPVIDIATGGVMISSQNHGFAVDEATLPANVRATHRSLFDGSLQGIDLVDAPAFGFQGHPEASPGPHDVAPLFDRFIQLMEARAVAAA